MKCRHLFAVLLVVPVLAMACTDFATTDGANNTALIAKNRDEHPDLQSVVAVKPKQGYKFVALMSQKKPDSPYVIRSGINQQGLAIVNMAAGILQNNPKYHDRYNDGDDFMRAVLTQDQSITEVMRQLPELVKAHPYPEFYMLADREQTALIELTTDGRYRATVTNSGPIYHTNNFMSPVFTNSNTFYAEGSLNRYKRIADLINNAKNPSLETFIGFAHDHAAGSNDSIFRTGVDLKDPKTPPTLTTFIAAIPKDGAAPTLYVQFYPKPVISGPAYTFTLNQSFWNFTTPTHVLVEETKH